MIAMEVRSIEIRAYLRESERRGYGSGDGFWYSRELIYGDNEGDGSGPYSAVLYSLDSLFEVL